MINFKEKTEINKQANETLENLLSNKDDAFAQYEEVSKITDLEVAKVIIKNCLKR